MDDADEVRFPLDRSGPSPTIDVVGIDYYAPLADWRDGAAHLDRLGRRALALRCAPISRPMSRRRSLRLVLRRAMPSAPRRRARRSPTGSASRGCSAPRISANWWAQRALRARRRGRAAVARPPGCRRQADLAHRGRLPGGRQGRQPAERVPRSEVVRKRVPYFSTGARDDLIQRRYLEALLRVTGAPHRRANPMSTVYGGPMVDAGAHLSVDLGRAALSRLSRRSRPCGATAPTGKPGIGSTAGSAPRRWTRWWPAFSSNTDFPPSTRTGSKA